MKFNFSSFFHRIFFRKKIILALAFGAVIISSFLSFYPSQGSGPAVTRDVSTFPLKVIRVRASEITPKINIPGTIEYFEKVNITSKTSGRIEKIFVKKGDLVRKNQALLSLEKLPLQLELKKNNASLKEARSSYKLAMVQYEEVRHKVEIKLREIEKLEAMARELKAKLVKVQKTFQGKKKLFEAGGISQEEFESARLNLLSSEASYQAAIKDLQIARVGYRDEDILTRGLRPAKDSQKRFEQLVKINSRLQKAELSVAESRVNSALVTVQSTSILLNETLIRSPLFGIVALRNKSIGEEVSGGSANSAEDAILVLVDISKVYANINVNEMDLQYIQNGMPFQFKTDVFQNKIFHGVVSHISPIVDTKTHTFEVKALVPNSEQKLRPGMFIRAELDKGKAREMITLSTKALLPKKGKNSWVFVVRDKKLFKIEVETGDEFADSVEIVKGIKNNDLVAIEKISSLRNGQKIQPKIMESSSSN